MLEPTGEQVGRIEPSQTQGQGEGRGGTWNKGMCWPVPSGKEVDSREKAGHRVRRKGCKGSTGGSEERTERSGGGGHSRVPSE